MSDAECASSPTLLPRHAELIAASGISDEVAAARGYRSITNRSELERLGFTAPQRIVPCLLIPIRGVAGEIASYQIRPDVPRIGKRNRPVKYETPKKSHMVVDVPVGSRAKLGDPAEPLFITEGARKADAAVTSGLCCIAILGVWNWRGANDEGGRAALADWESIALNDRTVHLAFDSDVVSKKEVRVALARLSAFLESRGARVRVITLPPGEGGSKTGLDDYLAAGHSVADLLSLSSEDPDVLRLPEGARLDTYEATPEGLVYNKAVLDGFVPIRLTNFTAIISADVTEDDGVESRHTFELETTLEGTIKSFCIPATQFTPMNWPVEQLGARAIIFPGQTNREHARVAIQLLSSDIERRRVFTHTGWRRVDGENLYIHAAGAIGPNGPVSSIQVDLQGPLGRYKLVEPPSPDEIPVAVNASLRMLDLAPHKITVPILAAVFRSVLGGSNFSIHMSGPTGEGKSALAAIAQQHFGFEMDALNLPGSWTSTGNALESLAFAAKDALFVVDDFVPGGTAIDVQRLQREAERLFRAQGNNSGRQRLRPDASLRPVKPPRGLVFSTGEDIPRGQSLRGRLLILEVSPGDLDWSRLTDVQRDAAAGRLVQSLTAFVRWLTTRIDAVQRGLKDEVRALRDLAFKSTQHRRTPFIIADLGIGLRYFLRFAVETGTLTQDAADAQWSLAWAALGQVAAAQARYQAGAEPAVRFRELLSAAIASGHAHIASPSGVAPDNAAAWGWRLADRRYHPDGTYEASGDRIGWTEADDLYLEPEASYAVAQKMARDTGDSLAVNSKTLHKRLRERKLLVGVEDSRGTLTVRRTLDGARREVLHVRADSFIHLESDQSDQEAGSDPQDTDPKWSDSRSDSPAPPGKTDHETDHEEPVAAPKHVFAQAIGQIGQIAEADETNVSQGDGTREVGEL